MYDLCVDGVFAFYQRRPGTKKLVRREPLVGNPDGVNTIFLTSHKPFLYDSLVVYAASPFTPATIYSADADGGVIRLAQAPVGQVVADYTAVPLTNRQIIYFAWAGFDLMQSLWSRDLRLSNDDDSYVAAGADDAHIYICSVTDDVPTDPVVGSLTFSTSIRQKALLARCIEFAFLDAAMQDAALSDVAIRERFGGIAIDPTRRTKNMLDAKAAQWEDLLRALHTAQDEAFGDSGDQYVTDVEVPHTRDYEWNWQWQYGNNLLFPLGNGH